MYSSKTFSDDGWNMISETTTGALFVSSV